MMMIVQLLVLLVESLQVVADIRFESTPIRNLSASRHDTEFTIPCNDKIDNHDHGILS